MIYPTADEIRAAHDAIERDGPTANTTIMLSAVVFRDPVFMAIRARLSSISSTVDDALILTAIVTGLNYGLRIHELRTGEKPS